MHPIEFVWFYRGDMKDGPIRMRSFAGLMILFLGCLQSTVGSLGKKLTMVDPEPVMSMAQGVAMPGGIMARLDLFDRILDRRCLLRIQRLFILWK